VREKQFDYLVALDLDGTALAEGRSPSTPQLTWTPEHLLLESLVRCTVASLRFHADRIGVSVDASGTGRAAVTRPPREQRMRIVDIVCRLDLVLEPLPEPSAVAQLLADAEHDCFVGATLKPRTVYAWEVNGQPRQAAGTPSGMRVPQRAPEEAAAQVRQAPPDTTGLSCGRGGRAAPSGDSAEWSQWDPVGLDLDELADPTAARSVLCPDCRAEEQTAEELGGG
jgi:organic hydroperoxide reductase OsmC/OhrA